MATNVRDDTFYLKEEWYPRICQFLPKTERILMNYIGKYRDRNIHVLNSPFPSKLVFQANGPDMAILYKVTNIDRDELEKTVSRIEKPEGVETYEKLNPDNCLFVMIIRYYMAQKKPDMLKNVLLYYAYCIYGHRFNVMFRPHGAKAAVMEYTVNNMSKKYDLKRLGSVEKWLDNVITVPLETYRDRFEKMSDIDIDYIISALITRIGSAVKYVRRAYQDTIDSKQTILESKEFIDGTNTQMEQTNFTAEVEKLSMEFTQVFFSMRPSSKRVMNSAKLANISVNELQTTLDMLYDSADIQEMREFMNCIFTVHFSTLEYKDIRDVDVRSIKFVQNIEAMFRKGNTKDVNILKAKDIMDGWLRRGSNTFRKTKRLPTIAEYRRGVYLYMILMISGIG